MRNLRYYIMAIVGKLSRNVCVCATINFYVSRGLSKSTNLFMTTYKAFNISFHFFFSNFIIHRRKLRVFQIFSTIHSVLALKIVEASTSGCFYFLFSHSLTLPPLLLLFLLFYFWHAKIWSHRLYFFSSCNSLSMCIDITKHTFRRRRTKSILERKRRKNMMVVIYI